MDIAVAAPLIVTLGLAASRSVAWLWFAPGFSSQSVPALVRGLLGVALTLPLLPTLSAHVPSLGTGAMVSAVIVQVVVGVVLGYVTTLLYSAISTAGSLIDLFGGFSLGVAYDPMDATNTSIFGRFHSLLAAALLFATPAHLVLIAGFMRSYQAVPLDGGLSTGAIGSVLTDGIVHLMLAAVEIAAPLVCVLFLSDVGMGLLTRVAPTLNALSLGFPIKILLTLFFVGMTFTLLPGTVEHLISQGTDALGHLLAG